MEDLTSLLKGLLKCFGFFRSLLAGALGIGGIKSLTSFGMSPKAFVSVTLSRLLCSSRFSSEEWGGLLVQTSGGVCRVATGSLITAPRTHNRSFLSAPGTTARTIASTEGNLLR